MNNKKTYLGLKTTNMLFNGHLTLSYRRTVTPSDEEALKEHLEKHPLLKYSTLFAARPIGLDLFGLFENIPVLRIQPSEALNNYIPLLHNWFPPRSEYIWTPHITIPLNTDFRVPDVINLTGLDFY